MVEELKNSIKWHKDKDYFVSAELRDDRQDSIWYDGLLFSYKYKGYRFSVIACGYVKIYYNEESFDSIYQTDITNDNRFNMAIKNGELDFGNNNWFELFVDKIDENGNTTEEIDNFVIDNITDCLDKGWVEDIVRGEE